MVLQTELDAAVLYRDAEVPFIIRNVPNLVWFIPLLYCGDVLISALASSE